MSLDTYRRMVDLKTRYDYDIDDFWSALQECVEAFDGAAVIAHHAGGSLAEKDAEIARLTKERDEARMQTSAVAKVLSDSPPYNASLSKRAEGLVSANESHREQIARLKTALKNARDWFQGYADGHAAKGDADKAQRNQDRADACGDYLDIYSGTTSARLRMAEAEEEFTAATEELERAKAS